MRVLRRVLMALTVGTVTALLLHGCAAALSRHGLNSFSIMADDFLTALLVGTIAYCLALYTDERNTRQQVRQRETALLEMNHHLRNALTMLKLSPEIEDASARRRAIESGVARIEFTLEQILPSTFDRSGAPRYFVGPQHTEPPVTESQVPLDAA